LKELYCISEASLDVLKVELWFVRVNLDLPMVMVAFAIFQALICVGMSIGKCLIFNQWLVWIYCHKEELQCLVYFCIYRFHCNNLLSESGNIYFNFAAVGRHCDVYWELL
jgi:hypothetical protein